MLTLKCNSLFIWNLNLYWVSYILSGNFSCGQHSQGQWHFKDLGEQMTVLLTCQKTTLEGIYLEVCSLIDVGKRARRQGIFILNLFLPLIWGKPADIRDFPQKASLRALPGLEPPFPTPSPPSSRHHNARGPQWSPLLPMCSFSTAHLRWRVVGQTRKRVGNASDK